MSVEARHSAIRLGTLALGIALFGGALYYINVATTLETVGVGFRAAALPRSWVGCGTWCASHGRMPHSRGRFASARAGLAAERSAISRCGDCRRTARVMLLSDRSHAGRRRRLSRRTDRLPVWHHDRWASERSSHHRVPLTPLWFGVFRAFAMVPPPHGVHNRGALGLCYFQSFLRHRPGAKRRWVRAGVARFTAAVERQIYPVAATRGACWCSSARLPRTY